MLNILLKNDEGYEQALGFNQRRLQMFTRLEPSVISIAGVFSPERRRVEKFIEDKFLQSYGAIITQHYPMLMSVRDENDTILGAVGFRCAKNEPLFLEQYLPDPIQGAHAKVSGIAIPRDAFVEAGNLASSGSGASIFLFTAIHAYLLQHGFTTIAVTATDFLHRYFLKLGLQPTILGAAEQSLLPDGGVSWGSYYEADPHVITGDLQDTYKRLKYHLKLTFSGETNGLRTRLHPCCGGRE